MVDFPLLIPEFQQGRFTSGLLPLIAPLNIVCLLACKQALVFGFCINPLPPNISIHIPYSPYHSLYISLGADKENLFNNQQLL